jgi:NADPH-dependent 2,4-dienoyl-CoA reductase/sulfur reductase-like enzyme
MTANRRPDRDENGVDPQEAHPDIKPLKIVIIGAGIGGLSAAIALRRVGHDVTVSGLFPHECVHRLM